MRRSRVLPSTIKGRIYGNSPCKLCFYPSLLITFIKVRAANSLLSITHSMKLLLLLSDEAQIAHRRDAELKVVKEESEKTKKEVAALLDELLRQRETDQNIS